MGKRILTAAVAIPIAVAALYFYKLVIFNILVAFVAGCVVFELLRAADCLKYKVASIASISFAALIPLSLYKYFSFITVFTLPGYLLLMTMMFIIYNTKIPFEKFSFMVLISFLTGGSMFCFIKMVSLDKRHGIIYLTLALCLSWIADSGAYFVGTFLGKHKLCPNISPKKTLEGFVGGMLTNGLFAIAFNIVYRNIMADRGVDFKVNIAVSFALGVFCAIVGTMGDLCASIVKRQSGIKDYGKLFPGHGGMLDRFDSVIFVVPFFYFAMLLFDIYS